MRVSPALAAPLVTGAVLLATPLAAQESPGVMGDLFRSVSQLEQKLTGLANAIPAEKYSWRPAEGVRSVGEVFQHVAADNYLLPAFAGVAPPPATGIKADDYSTVQAYENRQASHADIVADLQRSMAHLKQALRATPESRLNEEVSLFGTKATVRGLWILTTTHLHEHLGQMIAYARSIGVVPPWSRGG